MLGKRGVTRVMNLGEQSAILTSRDG